MRYSRSEESKDEDAANLQPPVPMLNGHVPPKFNDAEVDVLFVPERQLFPVRRLVHNVQRDAEQGGQDGEGDGHKVEPETRVQIALHRILLQNPMMRFRKIVTI